MAVGFLTAFFSLGLVLQLEMSSVTACLVPLTALMAMIFFGKTPTGHDATA